ncbi:MAG: zinc ribbon domain-containing protein [Treponema sp.]|nr:zinc ribbon domain-containing protein [Treponema sp.]MBQ2553196.1 zinc ribbon domain-containing protein [Treponema sp.]MBQ4235874.1 zinc ribbon domain-containing protein [Treponema sp.]MBQ5384585.1 zinc ribbon domain-containing protein [Treponema sp.]
MDNKKAKFFCENCGAEVLSRARFCPHCGKFFSAVRCPNCSYTGQVSEFRKGCPRCHYTDPSFNNNAEEMEDVGSDGLKHKLSRKSKKKIAKAFEGYGGKAAAVSGDTPIWVLVLSLVVLAASIIGIFTMLRCE